MGTKGRKNVKKPKKQADKKPPDKKKNLLRSLTDIVKFA
jgi:hypothetical protein